MSQQKLLQIGDDVVVSLAEAVVGEQWRGEGGGCRVGCAV